MSIPHRLLYSTCIVCLVFFVLLSCVVSYGDSPIVLLYSTCIVCLVFFVLFSRCCFVILGRFVCQSPTSLHFVVLYVQCPSFCFLCCFIIVGFVCRFLIAFLYCMFSVLCCVLFVLFYYLG